MSITTKRGDLGETSLTGNIRVSKGTPRVEACGTVDELNSAMGFARSICEDAEIRDRTRSIQRELFVIGAALATTQPAAGEERHVIPEMIDRLTAEVHRIERIEGVLSDWSIPGEHPGAAAYELARTVCRRAERVVVRLGDSEPVEPAVIAYLNRLSDLLWLFGRLIEARSGIDSALRGAEHPKGRWARAW